MKRMLFLSLSALALSGCPLGGEETTTGLSLAALSIEAADGSSLDFGRVKKGLSGEATLSVTNNGKKAAKSVAASGLVRPFEFKGGSYPGTGGTCGSTISSGETCTVVVTFTPDDVEPYTESSYEGDFKISYDNGEKDVNKTFPIEGVGEFCLASSPMLENRVTTSHPHWFANNTLRWAQSITADADVEVSTVTLDIVKGASSDSAESLLVEIRADCGGQPCSAALASGTASMAAITTTLQSVDVKLDVPYFTEAGSVFWLVTGFSGLASGTFGVNGTPSNSYSSGSASYNAIGVWNAHSNDLEFKLSKCE